MQRTGPVDAAITTATPDAVSALTDPELAKASTEQKLRMIDIVLPTGGEPLRRLWDSFGGGLAAAATSHPDQWTRSITEHPAQMRLSREVKTLQAAFALDVRDVAWAYLRENDKLTVTEMQRLGIPEKEGEAAPPTATQALALAATQRDAAELAKAQQTREQLRQTEIAYHDKAVAAGEQELPPGGVENLDHVYEPVLFDPDHPFEAAEQPTDYVPGVRTWAETNRQHVELTRVIQSYFIAHPALYALSRADSGGGNAAAVAGADPAQARSRLARSLYEVRKNIADARGLVPSLALEMTPIHNQLLTGRVDAAASLSRDWSKPFLHPLGQDVVDQQKPGPWWQQLGAFTLEAAAYVVAGLATGGIGPLLLAGGQAAISVGKYQALETASRSNVTPDTVLIQDGQVQAAAVEAVMSVAMAFIAAVGAARGLFAARMASAAGRALATEIGHDAARALLRELTPEAASALTKRIGAEAVKDLALRLGGRALDKLALELGAAELRVLIDGVGFEALELLTKDAGGAAIKALATDLGGSVLRNYGESITVEQIRAVIAKHGATGAKWLGTDLGGTAAKSLSDRLTVDAVKGLQDITATQAAAAVDKLGLDLVNEMAPAVKGGGCRDLAAMNMFTFDPAKQALIGKGSGAAVRGLGAIDGGSLTMIENRLTGGGFSKTASKGGQDIWTHPDGSVVRIKTGPEALKGARPNPHLVREISKKPGSFGTKDIFAKVAQDGTVIPQGTSFAQESLRQWFMKAAGRAPTAAELDRLMKVWGDAGHADVTIP